MIVNINRDKKVQNLANRRVVVTGVGFRASGDAPGNVFATPGVKPNIGAAVALEAVRAGYAVVIVARTAAKLERVRASILTNGASFRVID